MAGDWRAGASDHDVRCTTKRQVVTPLLPIQTPNRAARTARQIVTPLQSFMNLSLC